MGKTKVLVVDDEPETVDMLKTFLELFEFEVEGQLTGTTGMQAAIEGKPGVIILDLMLPDADGFQICRLLRHHAITKTIPIIILSARSGKDDERKGLHAGATVYLRKPVDLNRLVEDVRRVVASGHVVPEGAAEMPPAEDKLRPGRILKGGAEAEQHASKPGISRKSDTVNIPGMYIPRIDPIDKDSDKAKGKE
jgi:DNA-binding response OmpR family regulator